MRSERKIKTLAVTGGIGSGKSLVCSFFREKGIPVYDSDSRTKALYDTSAELAAELKRLFSDEVYGADGKLDRKVLARIIFSDENSLADLEAVVHPAVLEDFRNWRDGFLDSDVPFVILESAIILEKSLFNTVIDKVLVVDAPVQTRVKRASARDGVDESAVRARIASQATDFLSKADYIIMNDSSEDALKEKSDALFVRICKDFD